MEGLTVWHNEIIQRLSCSLATQYAEIETIPDERERLFMRAIATGDLGTMEYLLGQLLNCSSNGFNTLNMALATAIKSGNTEALIWMLQIGFHTNIYDTDGLTPLGRAASGGLLPVCRLLLQSGALIGFMDRDGRSPLDLAVANNHVDVVALLLDHKVSTDNTCFLAGSSALSIAALDGRVECARLLVDAKAPLETKTENGQTPLSIAAGRGHDALVQLLLDHEADIETTCCQSRTPLAFAASEGHLRTTNLLLNHGANMQARDIYYGTPVLLAAGRGHWDVVKLLLDRGDNIDAEDTTGVSARALAGLEGLHQIAEALVKEQADIEPTDRSAETPMTLAVANEHTSMVHLLTNGGVNVRLPENAVQNALASSGRNDGSTGTFLGYNPMYSPVPNTHMPNVRIKLAFDGTFQVIFTGQWKGSTYAHQTDFINCTEAAALCMEGYELQAMDATTAVLENAIVPLVQFATYTTANSGNHGIDTAGFINSSEPNAIADCEIQTDMEETFKGAAARIPSRAFQPNGEYSDLEDGDKVTRTTQEEDFKENTPPQILPILPTIKSLMPASVVPSMRT
ncbi:Phosphocholine transferase AnkX [Colletotrichum asianum]